MALCRHDRVEKKNMLLTALKNQTSHGSPWLSRVHQSVGEKQRSESSDWQCLKWINTRPFSILFFYITVIWGETHTSTVFRVCEWISLHSLCTNCNNWMTCSLNAACRQVGSFNSSQHNTCFVLGVFLPERFRAPRWTPIILGVVWQPQVGDIFSGNRYSISIS